MTPKELEELGKKYPALCKQINRHLVYRLPPARIVAAYLFEAKSFDNGKSAYRVKIYFHGALLPNDFFVASRNLANEVAKQSGGTRVKTHIRPIVSENQDGDIELNEEAYRQGFRFVISAKNKNKPNVFTDVGTASRESIYPGMWATVFVSPKVYEFEENNMKIRGLTYILHGLTKVADDERLYTDSVDISGLAGASKPISESGSGFDAPFPGSPQDDSMDAVFSNWDKTDNFADNFVNPPQKRRK